MDCSFVQHNLVAYRDNNLQSAIRRDIESHLSGCDSCRMLLTGMDSLDKIIEKDRAVEPDPFISTRILTYLENNLEKKAEKRRLVFKPILVTLAVVGAIALGFTIGKSGFDRISGTVDNKTRIETLKSDLYIHDFIEEDNTLLINE
jgi:predicted anti-sigma-YlaC factor YlaD